jgi:solute carrier family 39 (zinc transporter), member 1/2/3
MPQDVPWASLPTELLRAELSRRADGTQTKPQCGSGEREAYNTSIHVAVLFLLFFFSFVGEFVLLFPALRNALSGIPI